MRLVCELPGGCSLHSGPLGKECLPPAPYSCRRSVQVMLDSRQLQKYISALEEDDDALARHALQSLRQVDEQEWAAATVEISNSLVGALTRQLSTGTRAPFVQREAALVLGNIGPRSKSALPQLIALLRDGVPNPVREGAVIALGKIGREARSAVDPLVRLLTSSPPALTDHVVRALANIGRADDTVRSALVGLWPSPAHLRSDNAQVAIALCKLRIAAPNLVEVLTKTLVTNQDARLRKAAAEALAWCGKDETDAVPALLAVSLGDNNEEVRLMARAGLDKMRLSHEDAIHVCFNHLGDSVYAEEALRKSGGLAVPDLIAALAAKDSAIRQKAARILGCLGEVAAEAVPALTAALRDKDVDVRLAAAKCLWNVAKSADAVVPALVDLLGQAGGAGRMAGEVRRRYLQTVIEALSRVGPSATAAVSALTALTKDSDRNIRESALSALQAIAPAVASRLAMRR
jgi:HEAT repeat protein